MFDLVLFVICVNDVDDGPTYKVSIFADNTCNLHALIVISFLIYAVFAALVTRSTIICKTCSISKLCSSSHMSLYGFVITLESKWMIVRYVKSYPEAGNHHLPVTTDHSTYASNTDTNSLGSFYIKNLS